MDSYPQAKLCRGLRDPGGRPVGVDAPAGRSPRRAHAPKGGGRASGSGIGSFPIRVDQNCDGLEWVYSKVHIDQVPERIKRI